MNGWGRENGGGGQLFSVSTEPGARMKLNDF